MRKFIATLYVDLFYIACKRAAGMTNADLALRISLIARIAAQYTHELAYGMWNPEFCKAEADYERKRFLEEMDRNLDQLRGTAGQQVREGT